MHYGSRRTCWPRPGSARRSGVPGGPRGRAGARGLAAVEAIGRRLDLDYAGLDFTVLPDGRVLVFEANATMLVHLHDAEGDFPYKHALVPRILEAFEAMLSAWPRPAEPAGVPPS